MRAKHKKRAPQRAFAQESGTCQVCGSCFNTRLRLLAHLSDARRDMCWQVIVSRPDKFVQLTQDELTHLDNVDRVLRREAWRTGHTHPIASAPARTAAGALVGHVRA